MDMIVRVLPLKLKLWNSNLSVYGELTTTVLFFIGRIVSTSWCHQNGLLKSVLYCIVHSQGKTVDFDWLFVSCASSSGKLFYGLIPVQHCLFVNYLSWIFTGTLQLLLDSTLLQQSDLQLGDQINWQGVWVATAQLELLSKLLNLSKPTKIAVVEALIGVIFIASCFWNRV